VELAGRIAVVTGGAAGLGLATARALGEAGAEVVVLDRDTGVDVTDDAALRRAFAALDDLAEGIRVSCVAPGLMDTPAARRSGADLAQARPPEEVAAVIVELAADDESAGRVVTL
jgi:NAD(P)-dependent dehydrogenase (short-subunit alcohol dehydrogenase family)